MICFGYPLTTAVRSSVFFGLGALVFGTIDSANLQKPVNRLGIIMGRFGCTCSSEKKKWFSFLGSEYFAQRFNQPFDKNFEIPSLHS